MGEYEQMIAEIRDSYASTSLLYPKITIAVLVVILLLQLVFIVNLRFSKAMLESMYDSLLQRLQKEQDHGRDLLDRHGEVERSLRKQVQDLSQRLASIRIEHDGAVSEEASREEYEEPEPLSQALLGFLDGIEFSDARDLVEEEVYRMREQGYDDEQILSKIERGDDV